MSHVGPLVLICLAVCTSGCATVVRGTTATVTVDAEGDSAYVFVDGVPAGLTPARLPMKRSGSHAVEVVRDGFRTERAVVSRRFSPVAGLGSLVGGYGGVLIDFSSGALFDLDPDRLLFALVPDSTGVDAPRVAQLVGIAERAAATGFADADPLRRRPPPWWTVQVASGVFGGRYRPDGGGSEQAVGGVALGASVGARTEGATARLRGITAQGIFEDDADRWEVAGLLGLITETPGGRLRLSVAAGPGVSGGRGRAVCVAPCGSDPDRAREPIPARVGVAAEAEAFLFLTPNLGIGATLPAHFSLSNGAYGLLVGVRFEGL